jgi:hypothetical protein
MTDVVKKAVVLENNLPPLNTQTEGYSVRYRIVSEDRNRSSHWSPIYTVRPDYELVTPGFLVVEKNASHVLLIWNPVSLKKNGNFVKKATEYDVWLRWHKSDAGDWIFSERVEGTSLTVLPVDTYTINGVDQETQPNRLDVEIYLVGTPPVRSDDPNAFLKAYYKNNTTI